MPLPTPNDGEEQADFISRCMASEAMNSEYPENDQRAAVCHSQWDRKSMSDRFVEARAVSRQLRTSFVVIEGKTLDIDESKRSCTGIVTREIADTDGDVVSVDGLNLTRYKKNPIVLFMHDPYCIVGRSAWQQVQKRDGCAEILSKTIFAETEQAENVWQLVKGGFLKGLSIGMHWPTMKRKEITLDDLSENPKWTGAKWVIESANMLEYSHVSIPANDESLVVADRKGLIADWMRPYLTTPVQHPKITQVSQPVIKRLPRITAVESPVTAKELRELAAMKAGRM